MVKDAYKFALPPLIVGGLCLIPGWRIVAALLIFLGLFVFYFFRDPERKIPSDPAAVVSPADGHVVQIVDELLGWRDGPSHQYFSGDMGRARATGAGVRTDCQRGL